LRLWKQFIKIFLILFSFFLVDIGLYLFFSIEIKLNSILYFGLLIIFEILVFLPFLKKVKNLLFYTFILGILNAVFFITLLRLIDQSVLTIEYVKIVADYFIINTILKAGFVFFIHFAFSRKMVSFLSIYHKFTIVSIATLFIVSNFVSKEFLIYHYDKMYENLKANSILEIEKYSSLLKVQLIEKMTLLYHYAYQMEKNPELFNEKSIDLWTQFLVNADKSIQEAGIYSDFKKVPHFDYFALKYKDGKKNIYKTEDYTFSYWYKYSLKKMNQEANSIFEKVLIPEISISENQITVFITKPIYIHDIFYGVAKISLPLKNIFKAVQVQDSEEIFLLNDQSKYIYSLNQENIGNDFTNILNRNSDKNLVEIVSKIIGGKPVSGVFYQEGKSYWISSIGIPELKWKIGILKDISFLLKELENFIYKAFGIILSILFFGTLILFLLTFIFKKASFMSRKMMNDLGKGIIYDDNLYFKNYKDEFGEILVTIQGVRIKFRMLIEQLYANKTQTVEIIEKLLSVSEDLKNINQTQLETLEKEITTTRYLKEKTKNNQEVMDSVEKEIENYSVLTQENLFTMNEVQEYMKKILAFSKKIEEITDIIGEVVSQTHLLSLNASVEAARAGNYGKGFGVVALEIRKLASETGESAFYINNLISDSVKDIEKTNETIGVSTENSVQITDNLKFIRRNIDDVNQIFIEQQKELSEMTHFINNTYHTNIRMNKMIQDLSDVSEKIKSVFSKTDKLIAFFQIKKEN